MSSYLFILTPQIMLFKLYLLRFMPPSIFILLLVTDTVCYLNSQSYISATLTIIVWVALLDFPVYLQREYQKHNKYKKS